MSVVPRSFYARPTLDVLHDLIGLVLVHTSRRSRTAGIIVEAEAYIGENDPACHAAPGPTPRNAPLYGPPGFAYVYLNYGIHALVNVVTEVEGMPAAILIRALAPIEGLALMRRRRAETRSPRAAKLRDVDLCRGPGNLTVAMGIGLHHNRRDLTRSALAVEDRGVSVGAVAFGPRIGISVGTEQPWRCYWPGHPAVSGPKGQR